MSAPQRRTQLFKAGLLLVVVFLVLEAMPKPFYTIHINVNRTDVRSIEVVVADRVHATVVFDVLPNTHEFDLPEGRHALSILKSDGTRLYRRFHLNADQTITL